jgi:tRNA A-37 threonylcarbamoyl transferase component Bud32
MARGSTGPEGFIGSLYGGGWEDGHIETLIHLAAGYQFRERGVIEHLRRIAAYTGLLADAMGWSGPEARLVQHASVFHDVGMVDVPEAIVNKQGALSEDESRLVQGHTELGRELLSSVKSPILETAALLAWCHHERFDGTGYPRGISGEGIPAAARLLAVADVFDALTTDRPFKQAYPFEVAWEIVQAMSGTHFDPAVLGAMGMTRQRFEEVRLRLTKDGTLERKGFRISARDKSSEVFSIAREGYFDCPFCRELHPRILDTCPTYQIPLTEIHKLSGIVLDGKYKLRGALGVGGMGTVYAARHLLIHRRLAVKFLDPALATDQESLTRFSNEARVYSTVGHQNLVEVTDMGKTPDGIPYIVMEMLSGTDLARLIIDNGRLAPMAAVTIALEVLRTLAAVHAKGIIHRDLKPENVFLTAGDDGIRLKLLDFGISRLVSAGERGRRLTQRGIVFGTPQYMAPEQAQGRDDVDHRADIFTVGEILYEMVTGREVFAGENNLAILSAVTKGVILPPSELVPTLPREIEVLIMKALERKPKNRFQSAEEFMEPLRRIAGRDERFAEGRILDVREELVRPGAGA